MDLFQNNYLDSLGRQDTVFIFLSITIFVLFLLVILFAGITVILRLKNIRKAKKWKDLEQRLEPLVLDAIVGVKTKEEVWKAISKGEGGYFIDLLLRFARRLAGSDRKVIADLADPFLSSIVRRVTTGDAPQRARAISTLAAISIDKYAPQIRQAMDDDSPLVTMIAARSLSKFRDIETKSEILRHIDRFTTWNKSFLVSMLTYMGADMFSIFRGYLASEEVSPVVRTVVADALREMNDTESGDIAANVLSGYPDREVAAACLRLLAVVGRAEHIDLVRQLCNSKDFFIRANSLKALATLALEEDTSIFLKAVDHESEWVGIQAVAGLKQLGRFDIIQRLVNENHPRKNLLEQVLAEGHAL